MSKIINFIIKKYKQLNLIYFVLSTLILSIVIYLYYKRIIFFELFIALFFVYFLILSFVIFLYFFVYKRIYNLAKELNFKYLEGSFPHPKLEGYYKNNWFQLHYVSRDYGSNWGKPRTYIKLQFKELKKFDESKLIKYNNYNFNDHKIVEIKHIIRDYKNYLLLKMEWPTFNKKKVYQLMDFLIKVAKEAEIKKIKNYK